MDLKRVKKTTNAHLAATVLAKIVMQKIVKNAVDEFERDTGFQVVSLVLKRDHKAEDEPPALIGVDAEVTL